MKSREMMKDRWCICFPLSLKFQQWFFACPCHSDATKLASWLLSFSYSSVETSFVLLLLLHCVATAAAVTLHGNSCYCCTVWQQHCWCYNITNTAVFDAATFLFPFLPYCNAMIVPPSCFLWYIASIFLWLPLFHCCCCMPSPLLCNCVPVAPAMLHLNVAIDIEMAVMAHCLSCHWHPCCFWLLLATAGLLFPFIFYLSWCHCWLHGNNCCNAIFTVPWWQHCYIAVLAFGYCHCQLIVLLILGNLCGDHTR